MLKHSIRQKLIYQAIDNSESRRFGRSNIFSNSQQKQYSVFLGSREEPITC